MIKLAVLAAVVCFALVCSDPSQAKEKKKEKEQQGRYPRAYARGPKNQNLTGQHPYQLFLETQHSAL